MGGQSLCSHEVDRTNHATKQDREMTDSSSWLELSEYLTCLHLALFHL